ncbi:MAG: hypothetical protein Ta2A_24830 [Treponemataceae bacterium]|nr:MAG: hypothetical protein Ta2A_24830 [Treponemataceae bacterium]
MVRELHKAGIEVILDVVYNHTAEGNEHGVTISFRGIDNSIYYHLVDNQKQYYKNYSGCGNSFNCNHPVVRDFILDSLRYWVLDMHIDGFRFDLGTVLGRGRHGDWLDNAPLVEHISEDAVLAHTKIISEPWDAGGLYKLGRFFGRWAEWNDRYRDDVRNFWHGDGTLTNAAATRFTGSSDIFAGRKPCHSVNFVACHDGFTMNDMLSYGQKHNDDNGENNRDGSNNNASYNYGFEGASDNPDIEMIRTRQMKNLFLTLMLSQGTPMMLAGDEVRRTQNGNNNAYCQDNEISYVDWELCNKNAALLDFFKKAIRFRKAHRTFRRKEFFDGQDHSGNHIPDIMWFDRMAKAPDWKTLERFFACYLDGNRSEIMADEDDNSFLIICNTGAIDISIAMPPSPYGKNWHRIIDTSYASPNDFLDEKDAECLPSQKIYVLPERSMAVFVER